MTPTLSTGNPLPTLTVTLTLQFTDEQRAHIETAAKILRVTPQALMEGAEVQELVASMFEDVEAVIADKTFPTRRAARSAATRYFKLLPRPNSIAVHYLDARGRDRRLTCDPREWEPLT